MPWRSGYWRFFVDSVDHDDSLISRADGARPEVITETKKPLVAYPQSWPARGEGTVLTALLAAHDDNDFSISKKGNKMQAEKKNPSDPDAVVTADAGAVWVAE
jgi:hypothetical protein